jgi:phosphate-selective porin OprO/OprP
MPCSGVAFVIRPASYFWKPLLAGATILFAAGSSCPASAAGTPPAEPVELPVGDHAEHIDAIVDLPASVPGGELSPSIRAELGRLQSQINELQTAARQSTGTARASRQSDDAKKPSLVISGQVQADQVYFGQGPVSRASVGDLQDGAQFRRLRIGARGTSFEVLEYSLGVDFALANQPSYLDNYVEWKQLPWLQNIRAGHYFEPFSLERVTQNRNNTFMERSLVDTFAPARNMGVMTYGNTENELATWAIGTFRTNSDNIGNDSFDSGQALTMRGTWLPWWDEPSDGRFYMHLGMAYSYRATAQNQVRFRNTPEIRKQQPAGVFGPVGPPSPSNYINNAPGPFAPIFVDTGNIPARNFQLFDPEFALIMGPLSLQSEYACAFVEQIDGPPLFFNGYMAQLSWFLTGEHRPYDRKQGIHKRLEPFEDFFRVRTKSQGIQTGLGAWEIAARFSNIVLNDENIRGNNLTDFTVGLNWYLNPYTRWKFNYIRAFLQDERRGGNSLTDAYGIRIDYDF